MVARAAVASPDVAVVAVGVAEKAAAQAGSRAVFLRPEVLQAHGTGSGLGGIAHHHRPVQPSYAAAAQIPISIA